MGLFALPLLQAQHKWHQSMLPKQAKESAYTAEQTDSCTVMASK
jgi:hypothetical protein